MRGILYVVIASLLFGCVPSVNKLAILDGIPIPCLTVYIQVITCLLALLIILVKKHSLRISPPQLAHLLLVGAVGMGATSFLLNCAGLRIPVGLATMLHFLYPTVVSVVMVVLFGQAMTRYKPVAIVCSVCGMLMIADLGSGGSMGLDGILLALASGMTYAFYVISNEKGSINQLPLAVKLFYAAIGSILLFSGITLASGSFVLPETGRTLFLTVASGVGYMVAIFLFSAGINRIGASTASFINMLEPVTSVVVSMLLYREQLSLAALAGTGMILLSVALAALDSKATPAKQSK